jgi:hypothetical protein
MTDLGTLAPAAPAETVAATVLAFTHPVFGDSKFDFDCATIPANIRLDFLKSQTRAYVANRINSLQQRHAKDEKVMAWAQYEAAQQADAFQTAVSKPDFDKPAEPDYNEALERAFADLRDGKTRRHGEGTGRKPRERKDPLIKLVTDAVVKDVYEKKSAGDSKYTYVMARAEVGVDGVAYLNTLIAEKVAAAPHDDQPAVLAALEKMRETKYINPAKLMLGITENKAIRDLPSIL